MSVNPSLHYMLPDARIRGNCRISRCSQLLPALNCQQLRDKRHSTGAAKICQFLGVCFSRGTTFCSCVQERCIVLRQGSFYVGNFLYVILFKDFLNIKSSGLETNLNTSSLLKLKAYSRRIRLPETEINTHEWYNQVVTGAFENEVCWLYFLGFLCVIRSALNWEPM